MQDVKVRWHNFRGFHDTGELEIRPITVILGPNNCGKSSLFLPLLLMQQTLDPDHYEPILLSRGQNINAGGFPDLAHRGDPGSKISFDLELDQQAADENDCGDPFHYPPGRMRVSFVHDCDTESAQLSELRVYNKVGKLMLRRRRSKDGQYSIENMAFRSVAAASEFDRLLRKEFQDSIPQGFMFPTILATNAASRAMSHDASRETAIPVSRYWRTLDYLYFDLLRFFGSLGYLGPLRAAPQRVYEISGSRPESVGPSGERAPEAMFHADDDSRGEVESWLRRFQFQEHMEVKSHYEGTFSIYMTPQGSNHLINYADMGFGLSQILPLIVESVVCSSSSLLITEQPEIHLNPRLQTVLAELLVERVRRGGSTIVETHSEHLLLRLRRLVATGDIDAEKVALYFVERNHDESSVREVPIESNGHINAEAWPEGFFGEGLREAMELAIAQSVA